MVDICLAISGKQMDEHDRYITGGSGLSTFIAILILLGIFGGGFYMARSYLMPIIYEITGTSPDSPTGAIQTTATVTADSANFRSAPSTSGEIIKQLKKGDTITVTGNIENGWAPVKHGNDKGFVSADLIRLADG